MKKGVFPEETMPGGSRSRKGSPGGRLLGLLLLLSHHLQKAVGVEPGG